MNKPTKVYVCTAYHQHEGYDEPIAVHSNEEAAHECVNDYEADGTRWVGELRVFEFEVQDKFVS